MKALPAFLNSCKADVLAYVQRHHKKIRIAFKWYATNSEIPLLVKHISKLTLSPRMQMMQPLISLSSSHTKLRLLSWRWRHLCQLHTYMCVGMWWNPLLFSQSVIRLNYYDLREKSFINRGAFHRQAFMRFYTIPSWLITNKHITLQDPSAGEQSFLEHLFIFYFNTHEPVFLSKTNHVLMQND